MLVLIVGHSVRTVVRNRQWMVETETYKSAVSASPLLIKAYNTAWLKLSH